VDDRTGQPGVKLGVGLSGVELAQDDLTVRPGQFEDAVGEMAVLIFLDQAERRGTGFAMPVTTSMVTDCSGSSTMR
jgi:hypothetical protein